MVIVMIITGAEYISQLLNVTHTLQHLSIGGNDIGDDGMAVLSEALERNKSLTELWVTECGLSVKGTVRCWDCNVSGRGLKGLEPLNFIQGQSSCKMYTSEGPHQLCIS